MSQGGPTVGTLYVVATPIGNLADLSPHAREVLARVEGILAEDTRRAAKLLAANALKTPVLAFHEHNELQLVPALLARLHAGQSLALVADAGTPLVCDPGFRLVRACRQQHLPVVAVPGPSAVTAALSVAGLPPYPFSFLGFLPPRPAARKRFLATFAPLAHTLVLFLSPHRLAQELADCVEVLGGQREAALLAELSKLHERCYWGPLAQLQQGEVVAKGEFTLVVGPPTPTAPPPPQAQEALQVVRQLQATGLSLAQARKAAAEKLGISRKLLYELLERAKREE